MKKYFSAENVFIFQIFLHVTLFFIRIEGFWGFFLGQTVELSFILCLENMLKFLGPFKRYVRSDGGRERGYSTNVRKRTRGGGLPRVYVRLYFFKVVFLQLNCLCFLFFTSLKRKGKL